MTFYTTRNGTTAHDAYRARMVAEFERRAVSLPIMPRKRWTPAPAAPVAEVRT